MTAKMSEVTAQFVRKLTKSSYDNDWGVIVVKTGKKESVPAKIQIQGQIDGGYEFSAVGYGLLAVENSKCRYFGKWEDTKYGTQFIVDHYEEILPDDFQGKVEYLCSDRFKGIGKKIALNIVTKFGKDVFEIIENQPEKLLEVKGVTEKKMLAIKAGFQNTRGYREVTSLLSPLGFGAKLISQITAVLGEDAAEKIRDNPFVLVEHRLCGFRQADRIAKKLNVLLDSGDRIKYAILSVLKEDSSSHGNMYTEYSVLYYNALELLNAGFDRIIVTPDMFVTIINNMIKERDITYRKGMVFLFQNEIIEHETATMLVDFCNNQIPADEQMEFMNQIPEYVKTLKFKPSENQLEAVKKALRNRVMIITGGPGTGKTTILRVIIGAYRLACEQMGKSCVMIGLAPTGKARGRMEESTGIPCFTIHSACGIRGDEGLMTDEDKQLPDSSLIIVDEMSMVDGSVMYQMLKKIPKDAHIVLVGDADQLPSVGPGAVLNELLNSKVIPSHRLTEIFRQKDGSEIIDNAAKVNSGDTSLVFSLNFQFVPVSSEEQALDMLLMIYESECEAFGIDNVNILCPLRHRRLIAVDNLNAILQDKINPKYSGMVVASINGKEFRVHDRIIQMKNTTLASNGDIGVIQRILTKTDEETNESELEFYIHFESGTDHVYSRDDMMNVDLAYCLTIHKSQGSEYDSVIIPLLSSQRCQLFKRNLLYTGLTRAVKRVILIGDTQAINLCINTEDKNVRNTTLSARLKAAA